MRSFDPITGLEISEAGAAAGSAGSRRSARRGHGKPGQRIGSRGQTVVRRWEKVLPWARVRCHLFPSRLYRFISRTRASLIFCAHTRRITFLKDVCLPFKNETQKHVWFCWRMSVTEQRYTFTSIVWTQTQCKSSQAVTRQSVRSLSNECWRLPSAPCLVRSIISLINSVFTVASELCHFHYWKTQRD